MLAPVDLDQLAQALAAMPRLVDPRANALGGGEGADALFGLQGRDLLLGNAGVDRLVGGRGGDLLDGGPGRDVFVYEALADSTPGAGSRDVISDFGDGADRIDLSAIDARAGTPGNQSFVFLAGEGARFTDAGQVRWFQEGGDTFVQASVDADRVPELEIQLTGPETLSAADFVL